MTVPLFYKYIQHKLIERASKDGTITKEDIINYLSYYNIPKKIRGYIIKEFQDMNILTELNENLMKIKKIQIGEIDSLSRRLRRDIYIKSILKNNFFEY